MADESNPQQVEPTEPTQPSPTSTQTEPQSQPADGAQTDPQSDQSDIPDALASAPDTQSAEPEGAPETYATFTDANGKEYAPELVQGFTDVARKLGLSQEKAQKMFGAFVPTAEKYMHDDLVEKAKGWFAESEKDSEFGGERFKENLGIAKQAYKQYASPKLQKILNASGLGSHPEVVRLFYRIGLTMQQDHGVQGGTSAPAAPRRRYPKSNMVVDE